MVDAHILLGGDCTAWRKDALADIAQLPVTLHIRSAIPGQPTKARVEGWKAGGDEYITWFDPDDRYPTEASTPQSMPQDTQLSSAFHSIKTTPNIARR